MAQSILSDGSRGVWPEVRKITGKKGKMACSMDGCNDNDNDNESQRAGSFH